MTLKVRGLYPENEYNLLNIVFNKIFILIKSTNKNNNLIIALGSYKGVGYAEAYKHIGIPRPQIAALGARRANVNACIFAGTI